MKQILFSICTGVLFTTILISCGSYTNYKTTRGAIVGGLGGYHGYVTLGRASSQSEAIQLAKSKGYSNYLWDSDTGLVMGK